jgi:hypothetical protein
VRIEMVYDDAAFVWLAQSWDRETGPMSNLALIMSHPAARLIVQGGGSVVPLCLRWLKRTPSIGWCLLLRQITGDDPMPSPGSAGAFATYNVAASAKAWLEWGVAHGHLPKEETHVDSPKVGGGQG